MLTKRAFLKDVDAGLWERCVEQLEENPDQQMGLCNHAGGRTGEIGEYTQKSGKVSPSTILSLTKKVVGCWITSL